MPVNNPDPDELLTQLVDEVFKTSGALLQQGDALVSEQGLTASRWLVLGRLQDGPTTVAALARDRGLRRQSVQESMNRLDEDGYVTRSANPADLRAPLWSLTAVGHEALENVEPARQAWADRKAAQFPVWKLEAALAVLRQLRQDDPDAETGR
ncbi:MarR family winged helix-turn-helix transcriptional regulator [Leifsonia sp. NPDC058230]|uniref:MarR family winged helix-turn-helix transcriptional regulator n=1 Tax=Leifsonia sp. NPDC058230 TaxID=3346391 RepID=UPI0036D8D678